QVPSDRDTKISQPGKYTPVAKGQLRRCQEATQRIFDVWVSAGLVEHQITSGQPGQVIGDVLQKSPRITPSPPVGASGHVHKSVAPDLPEDVLGAIAIVVVVIQDADAQGRPLGPKRQSRNHQTVESAEAGRLVPMRVVEARYRSGHGPTELQRPPGSRQQGTTGIGQGSRHLRGAGAKAV